jgi:hypothetical protein
MQYLAEAVLTNECSVEKYAPFERIRAPTNSRLQIKACLHSEPELRGQALPVLPS